MGFESINYRLLLCNIKSKSLSNNYSQLFSSPISSREPLWQGKDSTLSKQAMVILKHGLKVILFLA